jgi:DMSO reductase iron-sulfur subunit
MTTLPLFESGLLHPRADGLVRIGSPRPRLIPERLPAAGEQYRFHFDMTKCIGCKCCVVACNEQNGNPATINWRRVGEIEGGHYPYTQRHYLSMGCNHCLEPSCMTGCPVKAYSKDPRTGVVVHDADACIGCQYCTWNCSYGVPQYNPERGVVGKCDLCHNRLADGDAPSCVQACPEGAITIETVNVNAWREDYAIADAPGLPSADDSISTTRITLPVDLSPDTGRVDTQRITPELPHWPLVFMLVLTQLAAGAFGTLWILDGTADGQGLAVIALATLALAGLSLGASTLHLGRPVHAWRALRGLGSSWLSREVFGLSVFAGAASLYSGMLWFDLPFRGTFGCATALLGIAGVTCSAKIYMVRARPMWDSRYTVAEFIATGLLLGPLFVRALGVFDAPWVGAAAAAGGALQLMIGMLRLLWLSRSEVFELRASSLLLSGGLRRQFQVRLALLLSAGIVGPLVAPAGMWSAVVLTAALAGEWLGRWLFFVAVVPKNMAAGFLAHPGGAA